MKSSTGQYYPALDHVRAIAAFLVFTWHFVHGNKGCTAPSEGAPAFFPFAILDQGHTGVTLFMVLSGYLFAKLLSGRSIDYKAFFWNRFIRLAPLLLLVFVVVGIKTAVTGADMPAYLRSLVEGFVWPTWPNGGWSVATEIHFYIALPVLIWCSRRWELSPLAFVLALIAIRSAIFLNRGEVQDAAYWTIVGRADDFLFGILAFSYRSIFAKRHAVAIVIGLGFLGFYYLFDAMGGYCHTRSSPLWIVFPAIEAMAYAALISYYDNTFSPSGRVSSALSKVGNYSYSIYLLHFFFVFQFSKLVDRHIMSLANLNIALIWAVVGFLMMIPIGFASYNFFEYPILRLRKRYVGSQAPPLPSR